MTQSVIYASSPLWEIDKRNRRFHLVWRGAPLALGNAQKLLDEAGLDIRLTGNGNGPTSMTAAVEAVVALGLAVHWQVPGSPQLKNRLRARLDAEAAA